MKQSQKLAAIAALGLGLAVTAYAAPEQMGRGMGPQGGMQHGTMGGMQQGNMGGTQHGGMGGGATGHGAGQQLMTPDERTVLMEKMHNAKTPEERQQIAAANHAEMQKRAQEKGIAMPGHHGPRFGATPPAPATK